MKGSIKGFLYFYKDYKNIIYTGPIDRYFDYKFGELEYKTTSFEHKKIDTDNYQGVVVMNYTEKDVPFTRTIEHKHFENIESDSTWVTWEFPTEYKADETEPYYPVNDKENTKGSINLRCVILKWYLCYNLLPFNSI